MDIELKFFVITNYYKVYNSEHTKARRYERVRSQVESELCKDISAKSIENLISQFERN